MTVHLSLDRAIVPPFVECLESLPNLHTLEIKWVDNNTITTSLENALENLELPQIKTLILPLGAYPLLRHCYNVEDVVYLVGLENLPPDNFLVALASIPDSKVKRLAVPLVLWADLPRKWFSIPLNHRVRDRKSVV